MPLRLSPQPSSRRRLVAGSAVLPALLLAALWLVLSPTRQAQAGFGTDLIFITSDQRPTPSLEWGDMNRDGRLDLVAGNWNQSNIVYLQQADGTFVAGWDTGSDRSSTNRVALGDIDGDGDLDMAFGNGDGIGSHQNQVYRNDGNAQFSLHWQTPSQALSTWDIALGDANRDGWLDLAFANSGDYDSTCGCYLGALNQVFLNNRDGTYALAWQSVGDSQDTRGVAWGDVDGDGDLDLAFGNNAAVNNVYQNDGNANFTLYWQSVADIKDTNSVAWGDADGDGDLDLAFANDSQVNQVYRNNGGGAFSLAWESTGDLKNSESVAWGDADGDGDLDLAIGNITEVTQIFANQGNGTFTLLWESTGDTMWTESVAWGDMEGDGDLDLAIGNGHFFVQPNQVYRSEGFGLHALVWSSTGSARDTRDVALGDADGDGDLDIAVANAGDIAELYRNEGNRSFSIPWVSSGLVSNTTSVAWGDMNGDGALDLAFGIDGEANRVLLNDGSGTFSLGWESTGDRKQTSALAWGDYDGDGDLDLAVANLGQTNQVFENQGGTLLMPAAWESNSTYETSHDLAWGDMDSDGDLDLAVANTGLNQVFRNDGSRGLNLYWESVGDSRSSLSVAWGDMDGDGDLDLAFGNSAGGLGNANTVYENQAGTGFTLAWETLTDLLQTRDVAWADVDGDRDLDLVYGNNQQDQVYQNLGGGQFRRWWEFSPPEHSTVGISAGDIDEDGDLDFAVGKQCTATCQMNQVLENTRQGRDELPNDGPMLSLRPPVGVLNAEGFASPVIISDTIISLPFNYMDPEGDTIGQMNAYFSPDGGGRWFQATLTNTQVTHLPGASWDDFDPSLDSSRWQNISNGTATRGLCGGAAGLGLNFNGAGVRSATTLPMNATAGGVIFFSLKLGDASNPASCETVDLLGNEYVIFEYSINGGSSWTTLGIYQPGGYSQFTPLAVSIPARAQTAATLFRWRQNAHSGTGFDNWALDNISFPQLIHWDTFASGFMGQSDNVLFRIEAFAQPLSGTAAVAGSYHYTASTGLATVARPYATAETQSFRVRGTQVQVLDETGAPAPGALVYHLSAGQLKGGIPFSSPATGIPFRTDRNGYLQGQGEIRQGDQLVALQPVDASSLITFTRDISLYYSSATPRQRGLRTHTVTNLGIQRLAVSSGRPLMLLNLDVSLEWDASADPDSLTQLDTDLKRASEILFDLSNGQMALGDVTVYQAKEKWHEADVQIYASNDQRPSANLGGIVADYMTDNLKSGQPIANAYVQGKVRIGPTWNRYGDPGGSAGEDWPRVLAHELGHYALFLLDNYMGLDPATGALTQTDCQGSAMTDAYRPDYSEFLDRGTVNSEGYEWVGGCLLTVAEATTGRSDWETVRRFYPFLNTNVGGTMDGPNLLPLAVTQVDIRPSPNSVAPLDSPFFYITGSGGAVLPLARGAAQAYLIHPNGSGQTDDEIVHLGTPNGPLLEARGALPGDRLCVYDTRNVPPRIGCTLNIDAYTSIVNLADIPGWQPEIVVRPVNSLTLAITVTQPLAAGELFVQIYPGFRPTTTVTAPVARLISLGNGVYARQISFPLTVFYGHVRVWEPGAFPARESITQFANMPGWDGNTFTGWNGNTFTSWGGNTFTSWGGNTFTGWGGNTFTGWGGNTFVGWDAPVASPDGQVLLFNADNILAGHVASSLQALSSAPSLPAWLTPVGQVYRYTTASPVVNDMVIQFRYLQRELPAVDESQLRIYFLDESAPAAVWTRLETLIDPGHNLASARMQGEGVYALLASVELPPFQAGWNLFGYPIQQTRPVTEALASIAGDYTSVGTFEPGSGTWRLYDSTVPQRFPSYAGLVNDLANLEFGRGYWLYATRPVTAYLGVPNTAAGVRLSGVTWPPATYFGPVLATADFTPAAGMSVEARIGSSSCGTSQLVTRNGWLVYKIHVTADMGDGCGSAGQSVTFYVNGQRMGYVTWDNRQANYRPLGPPRVLLPFVAR